MSARRIRTFRNVPLVDGRGTRVQNVTLYTFAQASQVGKYSSDLGKFSRGEMTDLEFETKWLGVSIGGIQVEGRARRALEAARRAGPPPNGIHYISSVQRDG